MKLSIQPQREEFETIQLNLSLELLRDLELLVCIFNSTYSQLSEFANKQTDEYGIKKFEPNEFGKLHSDLNLLFALYKNFQNNSKL